LFFLELLRLCGENNAKCGSIFPAFIFYTLAAFCPKNGGLF